MTDRQATLGDSPNEPEDWVDVYSHGSPKEGYLIAVPENHVKKELTSVTEDGYDSQVQAILEAVRYGTNHIDTDFKVYNTDESAIGCAQPGGNKPSTCNDLFKEIRDLIGEQSYQIRFETTEHTRQEILAL